VYNSKGEVLTKLEEGDYVAISPHFFNATSLHPFLGCTALDEAKSVIDEFSLQVSGTTGKIHKKPLDRKAIKPSVTPAFEKKPVLDPPEAAPQIPHPTRVQPMVPPAPLGGDDDAG